MTAPRIQRQVFAPMGRPRLKVGDLVQAHGCPGVRRIRAINYSGEVAELAHLSGAPAGEFPIRLLTPLAGGEA